MTNRNQHALATTTVHGAESWPTTSDSLGDRPVAAKFEHITLPQSLPKSWLLELVTLLNRHSSLGAGLDLQSMPEADLWGLRQYLLRLNRGGG